MLKTFSKSRRGEAGDVAMALVVAMMAGITVIVVAMTTTTLSQAREGHKTILEKDNQILISQMERFNKTIEQWSVSHPDQEIPFVEFYVSHDVYRQIASNSKLDIPEAYSGIEVKVLRANKNDPNNSSFITCAYTHGTVMYDDGEQSKSSMYAFDSSSSMSQEELTKKCSKA